MNNAKWYKNHYFVFNCIDLINIFGGLLICAFCIMVELTRGGSVTNRASLSSVFFKNSQFLPQTDKADRNQSYCHSQETA